MISSKKISVIGTVLISAAVLVTVFMMIFSEKVNLSRKIGVITYSENHSVTYYSDDYYSNYSNGFVSKINLNGSSVSSKSKNVLIDGTNITILKGGTYVVSGELNGGSIIVDSSDDAEVRIVLNGANIMSEDFPALYVKNAKKTVISLVKDTENNLSDSYKRSEGKSEDERPSAALYSKDDLTINGKGALTVTGNYEDGIKVNDGLKITECVLKVEAKDEGINANDYIAAVEAKIEVNSENDGIKCENEDTDKGFTAFNNTVVKVTSVNDGIYASSSVYVDGGNFEISAGDDALHSENKMVLNPENLTVANCYEGIESGYITINGGNIKILSRDDAINAVGTGVSGRMPKMKEKVTDSDVYLTINGGNIYIETSGDGIDSNGAAVVSGGNIEVYGPENSGNSSLDFEYAFVVNGGTILAAGSSGMAESPHSSSGQNSIVYNIDGFKRQSEISVIDSKGDKILSGISPKSFNWVLISSPKLVKGENYTLKIDGTEIITAEVTDTATSVGEIRSRR